MGGLFWKGFGQNKHTSSIVVVDEKEQKQQESGNSNLLLAREIVLEQLEKDRKESIRFMIVGVLVALLGVAFFWLFGNSWHVTQTSLLGGLPGLIHALTVMEVALAILLVYMLRDASDKFRQARIMERVQQQLLSAAASSSSKQKQPSIVG